jgi:hypothetical protein
VTSTWNETLAERLAEIQAGLKAGCPGLRSYASVQSKPDPPAVVFGPPKFEFEGGCVEPTNVKIVAFLVAAENDKSISLLVELLPQVCDALYAVDDVVVIEASPAQFPGPSGSLPAYAITIEFGL